MGFFNEFYEQRRFIIGINSTFLVLIPRKGDAVDIEDLHLLVWWVV